MTARPRELHQPHLLPLATPREIFEQLDRSVVGQEEAKRTIAIAAYNHLKRIGRSPADAGVPIRKSNVLLIGPSGSGKTHLARCLAAALDLPFAMVDATEYTEAGYHGKDVELMLTELLHRTSGNVAAAERGIVFVDEIDKLARRETAGRFRDVAGAGVQQSMLRMLDGGRMFVPATMSTGPVRPDYVQMDTRDVLFICAGTFSDLRRGAAQGIGFPSLRPASQPRLAVSTQDLVEYGIMVELLGRVPVVVELDELTADDLVRVLTVPPDGILEEYRALLAMDGISLRFERDAVRAVADAALGLRLGARGLRRLVDAVMRPVMFDAPERRGTTVVMDAATVRDRLAT